MSEKMFLLLPEELVLIINKLIPIIFLVIFLCTACGKQKIQKLSNDRTMYKSTQALQSCEAIKLPADIDFNGKFLYHFFRCFSDKKADGTETMGSLLDIMSSFDVSGMQNLTNLLKYSTTQKDSKKEYPLIRMLVTLIERGVVIDDQIDGKNYSERFGTLQDLFKDFDPSFVMNLILESQNDLKLQTMLNLLGDLTFKIDPNIFLSYLRSFLEKEESRGAIYEAIDQVVNYEDLWSELTAISSFEQSFDLKINSQSNCLNASLVTYSKTEADVACQIDTQAQARDAEDRVDSFLSELDVSQKKLLYETMGELLKNVTQTPFAERNSRFLRLKNGLADAWFEQKNPLLNLVSIASLLSSTKAAEMNHLINAIKALIEDPNIPALFFANLKLGNTNLEKKVMALINKGGNVSGCKNLILKGTAGVVDEKEFYHTVSSFFNPHPMCDHELSPVISFVVKELNRFNHCESDFNEEFCISGDTLAKFKKVFHEIYFNEFLSDDGIDPVLLRNLLENSLRDVADEIKKEPYYLRFNHLAYGAVDATILQKLLGKIQKTEDISTESIALLDEEINKDESLNKILVSDFIEKMLTLKIEKLKMISYEFDNITDHGSDYRLYRVLSGLYASGPLEKLIDQELSFDKIKESMTEYPATQIYRLKETLSRAHGSANLFQDNRLEFNDSEIDFKLIGDKNRGMTFDEKGNFKFTRQKPAQIKDIFSNNTLRFENLFKNGDLMGKDVADTEADEFSYWIESLLYDHVTDAAYWKKAFNAYQFIPSLSNDRSYFEVVPYSIDEIRKVAHFNSMNYLSVLMFLPLSGESSFYISNDKVIKKQFTGPMINGELNWSTFSSHYPEIYNWKQNEEKKIYFSQIRKKISESISIDSFKAMMANGPFKFLLDEDRNIFDVKDIGNSEKEIFKVLQSLNLLTQNKNKDYMPILSLKNGCFTDTQEQGDCPLTFFKDGENEEAAFNNLKKYIADIYLFSLCPYLDSNKVGVDIGITLDQEDDVAFCNNSNFNYLTSISGDYPRTEIYPYSLRKSIMADLFTMGKSNRLKPGLDSLVSKIRYYKAKKQNYSNKLLLNFWLSSPASVTKDMIAYSYKFSSDHKGFNSTKSGLLNTYLFYAENVINNFSSSRVYENALARFGADVATGENPEKGKLYKFIYDVIINTHSRYQQDGLVSDWLIDMLYAMKNNDEYVDIMASLLINPSDNQTINMFKNLLGLYIKRIKEIMEEDPTFGKFTWNQNGNKVIKQVLKQDIWWMITDLINQYTQDEFKSFLKTCLDLIPKKQNDLEDTKVIFKTIIKHLGTQTNAILDNQGSKIFVGKQIQDHTARILKLKNSDQAVMSINALIEELTKTHFDFHDHEAALITEFFAELSEWSVESMLKLMKTYQVLVSQNPKLKMHGHFLKRLINSFISPFRNGEKSLESGKVLSDFLKIRELGTFETIIRPILFPQHDGHYQKMFLQLIDSMGKINAEIYKSSLIVLDQLLSGTKVLLNFITDNINWESQTSKDTIMAIKSINRVSDFSNGIWKAQDELFNSWFEKGIMYRQIPLKE